MARLLRTVCLIAAPILVPAALGALPAAAQFNPFETIFGAPPRPPGDVPGGRQPPGPPPQQQGYPQYPDQQRYPDQQPYPQQQYPEQQQYPSQQRYPDQQPYPGQQQPQYPAQQQPQYPAQQQQPYPGQQQYPPQQQYPEQARQAPPGGGIQSQPLPLPPPPGGTAALPPGQPLPAALPPGQRPRGAPQPGDEVIVEPPSQKIVNKGALFSGLDKITGRIINFDVAIGETVQFGALQVTPRICYTRPPTETSNTDAFIEVDEVTLQGEVKRIFTGWMFASSPGLHAVEHPIYDVWLTDCKSPVVAAAAPAEAAAPAVQQPARPPAAPKRPPQQTPPGTVPRR